MTKTIITICSLLISLNLFGQIEVYMELSYKLSEGKASFTATIIDDDDEVVAGVPVQFAAVTDETEVEIGEVITDNNGIAVLGNIELSKLNMDSTHQFEVQASFAGNDDYEGISESGSWKELKMELTLNDEEDTKMVGVQLNTWNDQGEPVPVEEGEVYFYVPRLFSLLPIGDAWTEEEGYDEIKFPSDLPGDINGELTIVGRIEDDDTYGNVEARIEADWGTIPIVETKLPRALWSSRPPVWMVVTFVVLMGGVWIHYLIVAINLLKINKSGNSGSKIDFNI